MRPLTVINLVSLTLMVILFTIGVNCSSPAQQPIPIQSEKVRSDKRIALAYMCGLNEGRYGTLQQMCEEYRTVAEAHGLPRRIE